MLNYKSETTMKLRSKFLISIILLIVSMNFIFAYYILSDKTRKEYNYLEENITNIINTLSESSSIPLWNYNLEVIQEQVKITLREKAIFKITLLSEDLKEEKLSITTDNYDLFKNENLIHKKRSIKLDDEILGFYEVIYSDLYVKKNIEEQKNNMILLTILLIVVVSIAINFLVTYFLRPINKIVQGMEVIDNGNTDFTLKLHTNDEFNKIEKFFNSMINNLRSKEKQKDEAEVKLIILNSELESIVKKRTSDLEISLKELKLAQNQLLQSEKMSMLGRMVAGVTHEINSPLGICVSLSSNLNSHVQEMKNKYTDSKMKKKDLDSFLLLVEESSTLIFSNINRATSLIKSFKTIAVDQTSEFKRTFDLIKYLDDIKLILKNKFKNRNIDIVIDSTERISIYNNPGIFYQIFTNLINNSLLHGFDKDDYGEIKIKCYIKGPSIIIDYSDNGKGINDVIKDKIFDKFFTTKRDGGGSGLGLHIISNLISENLNGTIELLENPDTKTGILFRIKIKFQPEKD